MRTALIFILAAAVLPFGASAATITTTFAGGNEFAGNMFDVTNVSASSVDILGTFEVNLDAGATGLNVSVYYRPGTYVGFEGSAAGWTLLGVDNGVASVGADVPTPIDVGSMFSIGAGQTYGLYVTVSNYSDSNTAMRYTNGSNVYNDGVLQITTGVGTSAPDFSGIGGSPRTWNGSIDYRVSGATVPEPSTWTLLLAGVAGLGLLRRRR